MRHLLFFIVIYFSTQARSYAADPETWQALEKLDGHVFQLVCSENEKCGSAPVILKMTTSDRIDFELKNSSITEFYLKGVCLSRSGSCAKTVDKMTYNSKVISKKNGLLKVGVQDTTFKDSKIISLKENPYFLGVKLNSTKNSGELVQRTGVKEASDFLQTIAPSVFRLRMPPPEVDKFAVGENAYNTSSGYGSGFFISPDGYVLTNWHVVASNPECLPNYGCELAVGTHTNDGQTQEVKKYFRLLASDRYLDVALLKMEGSSNVPYLSFENEIIESQVLTVGYPSDRENNKDGPLTYSYGQFQGFFASGFAFLTSAKVSGGASGSPLLNVSNSKVVAIVSANVGSDGMSLARPIHIVSKYLRLHDYFNGTKELRVKKLIGYLEASQTAPSARLVLNQLKAERTLLLGPDLEELAITHPTLDVRKEISIYLKRQARENGPR